MKIIQNILLMFILVCQVLYGADKKDIAITVENRGRRQKTKAVTVMKARPDEIWNVITDFDRHGEFMPRVIESRIIHPGEKFLVVYKRLNMTIKKISFTLKIHMEKRGSRYSWQQEEGPFVCNNGMWILKPSGDCTRVTYVTEVEPKFYIPAWIKKLLVKKTVPRLFNAVEEEIFRRRNVAGTSGGASEVP